MNGTQVLRRLEGTARGRLRPPGHAADAPPAGPAASCAPPSTPRWSPCFAGITVFIGAGLAGTPWYRFVTIEGGSMAPAIARGDLILVTPAPAQVEPGMILVLRVGGQLVTHRVVAVNADGTFITRGDANAVDDAWGGQPVTVRASTSRRAACSGASCRSARPRRPPSPTGSRPA